VGHRLYALGVDGLHFGDQAKNIGQLGMGGMKFLLAHGQPGQAGNFFDIG
jgi:hypothetical protein